MPLKITKIHLLELVLIIVSFLYYAFFLNRGIVLFDEGYFVHSADRIVHGEIPYKDFSLQYGPLYFYALALFFKIFGQSIIIGRIFAMLICLGILTTTFLILNKLRIKSYTLIILSTLCVVAFGYPLINIPNLMWANALSSLLTVLIYLYWYKSKNNRHKYLFLLGFLVSLSLGLKQNIGFINLLVINFIVFFSKKRSVIQLIKDLLILNLTWIMLTFIWIYYFFLRDNLKGLFEVVEFSKKFASSISFTIPPLTFILKPLGIFKLLPYYTPIVFGLFLITKLIQKKVNWPKFAFAVTGVTGFAVTIFPQSDLLHVYPFLGAVLVSILLFGYESKKLKLLVIFFIIINILIGFYLTFFTRSYRYEEYYLKAKTPLNLPRTQGLFLEPSDSKQLMDAAGFINKNTKKDDYILAYPYAPMLYFIFDRRNPTKDPIYYQRNWHFYDDGVIIKDLKTKHVKFIIAVGEYRFDSDLSKFIQKQPKVFTSGVINVFQIEE